MLIPIGLLFVAAAIEPSVVNDGSYATPVNAKGGGAGLVRAQILMDRAHISSGEIDGSWGHNVQIAIAEYRSQHNLPAGEIVDAAMWTALNQDTAPALIDYEISPADVAGPFEKIPVEMADKAKLKHLGYQSAQEALAEKFHCSPGLLATLNPGKKFEESGVSITVPNVITAAPGRANSVLVNGKDLYVQALDASGNVLAFYPASVGSEHDPLPVGDLKILGVSHNPIYNYNSERFWDAKGAPSKATIAAGPRNPVGSVWIALSKEHYGIHGSPTPAAVGHTQSHGCIRLTNWDAEQLASMVRPGVVATLKEK